MKHDTARQGAGAALVGFAALGYATNPILAKIAYQAGATAINLMATRFLLAAAGLWLIVLVRRESQSLPLRRRLQLLGLGVGGFAMVALLYFSALQHMDASLASGIFFTYPAMVTLVTVFRGTPLNRLGYGGLGLTIAGSWLMLGKGEGGFSLTGLLMILASAGFYTAYILASSRWTQGISPTVSGAYVVTGAAAVYVVLAVFTGQAFPQPLAVAAGAGLAVMSTIVAMVAFLAGMARIGAIQAAILGLLEPVFTAIMAVLLIGESITGIQMAGMGLIVAGAVLAQIPDPARRVVEQA